MSIIAKPTSYTVNTAHAKCPDHLFLMDEGSGTSLTDQGKVGGLTMTLANADMRGSDALGAIITTVSATARHVTNTSYTPPSTDALWLAIYKTTDATPPAAISTIISISVSAGDAYGLLHLTATNGYGSMLYDYGTFASGNQTASTGRFDQAWHMIAGHVRGGTTVPIKRLSEDGAAWQTSGNYTATWPNDGGGSAPTRIGFGCRPITTPNTILNGSLLAVMLWDDIGWGSVDDTWISDLYTDPWQFLNTTPVSYAPTMGRCVYILP